MWTWRCVVGPHIRINICILQNDWAPGWPEVVWFCVVFFVSIHVCMHTDLADTLLTLPTAGCASQAFCLWIHEGHEGHDTGFRFQLRLLG